MQDIRWYQCDVALSPGSVLQEQGVGLEIAGASMIVCLLELEAPHFSLKIFMHRDCNIYTCSGLRQTNRCRETYL